MIWAITAEQSLKNEGEPQWSVYSICILNWKKGDDKRVISIEMCTNGRIPLHFDHSIIFRSSDSIQIKNWKLIQKCESNSPTEK